MTVPDEKQFSRHSQESEIRKLLYSGIPYALDKKLSISFSLL